MRKTILFLFLLFAFSACGQDKYDATIVGLNQQLYLYSTPNATETNKFEVEMPKHKGMKIIGRTNKKELINQKNDFWYLAQVSIRYKSGNSITSDEHEGWIHGSNVLLSKDFVFKSPAIPKTIKGMQSDFIDCDVIRLNMVQGKMKCGNETLPFIEGTHYFIDDNICITNYSYEDGTLIFLISKYTYKEESLTITPYDVYYEYTDGARTTNQFYKGAWQHLSNETTNVCFVSNNIYFVDYSKIEKENFVIANPVPIKKFSPMEQEIIKTLKIANKL